MNGEINAGRQCPYCLQATELIDSEIIYGVSHGMLYACLPCQAWVGVHQGSTRALGRVATKELRTLRHHAHLVFDPLYIRKAKKDDIPVSIARQLAYEWIARELSLEIQACHISLMDADQIKQLIKLCKPYSFNQ